MSALAISNNTDLRKGRLDDLAMESARLVEERFISEEEAARLDALVVNAADQYLPWGHVISSPITVSTLLKQGLGIKKQWESTHYVFTHGQDSLLTPYMHALKEIAKKSKPNLHAFKVLRSSQIQEVPLDIGKYRNDSKIDDHDEVTQTALLATSGNFWETRVGESAIGFMATNRSYLSFDKFQEMFAKSIRSIYPKMEEKESINYAKRIAPLSKKALSGNLYVICIDKKEFANVAYAASPGGRERIFSSLEKELEHLELAQKRQQEFSYDEYQYRLYMPAIKPGQNHRIFMLNPLPQAERKAMKAAVKAITDEMHQIYGEETQCQQ